MPTPSSRLVRLVTGGLLCGLAAGLMAEEGGLQFPPLGPGATEPTGPDVPSEKYQRYLGGVGMWGDLAPMRPVPAPQHTPPVYPEPSVSVDVRLINPQDVLPAVPPGPNVVQVDPPAMPPRVNPQPLPYEGTMQPPVAGPIDPTIPPLPNSEAPGTGQPPVEMRPHPLQYAQAMNGDPMRKHTPNSSQVSFTRDGGDFSVDVEPVSGSWLVYSSTQHRPTADLYLKSTDGNTVTQITTDPASDIMPAISPDGRYVAFASDRSGNWDIWVMPLSGGRPMQVTQHPSQELHPSWSRDGQQLVFCSLSERDGEWEMVAVDWPNSSRRRHLGPGLFPKFSPDGKKIAYQRARQRGSRTFSIWTVDYMNGEIYRPTEVAAASNAALIHPAWSPDSRRLAFSVIVHPSSDPEAYPDFADIWTVGVDGSGLQQVTSDGYTNLQPVWGPRGQIFYISNRTGWDNIWSIRVEMPGADPGAMP